MTDPGNPVFDQTVAALTAGPAAAAPRPAHDTDRVDVAALRDYADTLPDEGHSALVHVLVDAIVALQTQITALQAVVPVPVP